LQDTNKVGSFIKTEKMLIRLIFSRL